MYNKRKCNKKSDCDCVHNAQCHRPEDIHPIQLDHSYWCRFRVEFHEVLHPVLPYLQRAVKSKKEYMSSICLMIYLQVVL